MLYYFGRLWMKVVFVQICFEKSTRKPVRLPTCDKWDKWQKPTWKFSVKSLEILPEKPENPENPEERQDVFRKQVVVKAPTHPKIGQFLSKSCKSRRRLNGLDKEQFWTMQYLAEKAVRTCVKNPYIMLPQELVGKHLKKNRINTLFPKVSSGSDHILAIVNSVGPGA